MSVWWCWYVFTPIYTCKWLLRWEIQNICPYNSCSHLLITVYMSVLDFIQDKKTKNKKNKKKNNKKMELQKTKISCHEYVWGGQTTKISVHKIFMEYSISFPRSYFYRHDMFRVENKILKPFNMPVTNHNPNASCMSWRLKKYYWIIL